MNKEILKLSIPNILSNLSIPLLSSVDTLLMGHLSSAHLASVGLGSMIFNFIYWNFGFLRMGTTGITAQAYGANDQNAIKLTLLRSCLLAVFLAFMILLFSSPLERISYYLLNVNEEHFSMIHSYYSIRILAAPFTLLLYALIGWFFGLQNALYPLIITVVINILNIVFSSYFVVYLGWEIEGVAIGTVMSQVVGCLLAIGFIVHKRGVSFFKIKRDILLEIKPLIKYLEINRDLFFRTVLLTLAFGFFYSQSSKMGTLALAANVILLQFLNWISYGIDGFAFATESLVGKYVGQKNSEKLNQVILYSFLWGLAVALFYSIVFLIFGHTLIEIFTDQKEVITETQNLIFYIIILPVMAFASYIWDGIFIGFTASVAMLSTMLFSFLIYIIAFYTLQHSFDNALWISLIIFLLARGITQTIWYYKIGINSASSVSRS